VYDTTLDLRLIKDGVDMGGAHFSLGTIEPERGVKVTTGLVLSGQTPPGTYIARATVRGVTGPDNSSLEASADSSFLVWGTAAGALTNTPPESSAGETAPSVLGFTQPSPSQPNILFALLTLLLLIPQYIVFRIAKDKALAMYVLRSSEPILTRLQALRMLLL